MPEMAEGRTASAERRWPGRKDATAQPEQPALVTFLRCFVRSPREVASLFPSSAAYARLIAANVICGPDECVVETGAGTGSVTEALLRAGVRADRLFVIELNDTLAAYLRRALPGVTVIEGDAASIPDLLPAPWHGRVGTVVSGIPLSLLAPETQRAMIEAMFAVMPPGRRFLQLTHRYTSPLRMAELGLTGERLGFTLANLPPATVWGYRRAGE